jgi:hypothetical protein
LKKRMLYCCESFIRHIKSHSAWFKIFHLKHVYWHLFIYFILCLFMKFISSVIACLIASSQKIFQKLPIKLNFKCQ